MISIKKCSLRRLVILGIVVISFFYLSSCKEMGSKDLEGNVFFSLPQQYSDCEITLSVIDDSDIDITNSPGSVGFDSANKYSYINNSIILDEQSTVSFLDKYYSREIVKNYEPGMIVCHKTVADYLNDLPSKSKQYLLEITVKKGDVINTYNCSIHLSEDDESESEYIIEYESLKIYILFYYDITYYI